MLKIGITGNIASGKSLVQKFFQEQGFVTLDTDEVVHTLYENDKILIQEIFNLFDEWKINVRNKNGLIDRKKIAEIVFLDREKLKKLESIVHPAVKKEVKKFFLKNQQQKIVAISVPLLFEAEMQDMFDYIILVVADDETRIQRLINKRGLSQEQSLKRINSQPFDESKFLKSDFIIENNGSVKELKIQVKNIFVELIKKVIKKE